MFKNVNNFAAFFTNQNDVKTLI